MDLREALAYLDEHVNLEKVVAAARTSAPTLDRIRGLCDLLGEPQRSFPSVHVTGTNGKGSTARMATALLAAHGITVGTFTSPNLERVNERIARNGEPIDDGELARAIAAVAAVEPLAGVRPNYFDILTAAGLWWFADVAVDLAVVEVGMLGRFDSTNVVDGDVAVVTNVGLDHTQYAGPTRAHVAAEKAGIVKPGSTLVLGEEDPDLVRIFEDEGPERLWLRGRDFACTGNHMAHGGRLLDIHTPYGTYDGVHLPLHGAHQGENAAVAVAAVEAFFDRSLDQDVVQEAFAAVRVPGRFEVVGRRPLVILDGAHNPDAAEAAMATLDEEFEAVGSRVFVLGVLRGHDLAGTLAAFELDRCRLVVTCAADWPKAVPAEDVAKVAADLGAQVEVVPAVADAVEAAISSALDDDVVLVTGSLYVVGEARAALRARGSLA